MIEWTTVFGAMVRLPVFNAQGMVDEFELKYPPKGQPLSHNVRAWHCDLPCSR